MRMSGGGTNLQLLGNGTNNFTDLLSVLEGDKRGHLYYVSETQLRIGGHKTYGPNANLFGDVLGIINIDFVEADGRDLLGEFFEDGADHSAWTTPGCPEIEDDDLVTIDLIIRQPKERRLRVSLGTRGVIVTWLDPRAP